MKSKRLTLPTLAAAGSVTLPLLSHDPRIIVWPEPGNFLLLKAGDPFGVP